MSTSSTQSRQPAGAPTGGQFAQTMRTEPTVSLPAPRLTVSDIDDAQAHLDSDYEPGPAYFAAMERMIAGAREAVAYRATLDTITELLRTADRASVDEARGMLDRVRRTLEDAGHLPAKATGPDPDRRIEAPFEGTPLDRSPALATSHLQLQGTGTQYALILTDRMPAPMGRRDQPAVLATSPDDVEVWAGSERLTGFAEEMVWRRIAAGSDMPVDQVRAGVVDRILTANTSLTT